MNLISDEDLTRLQDRIVSDEDIDLMTVCHFLALTRQHRYFKARFTEAMDSQDRLSRCTDLASRILARDEHALSTEQLEAIADIIFGVPMLTPVTEPIQNDLTQIPTVLETKIPHGSSM